MPFAYDPNGNLVGTTGTGTGLNASSINGVTVTGTASNGKVLTATSATAATWQTPASSYTSYLAIQWNGGFVNNVPQFYTYGPYALNTVSGSDLSFNVNLTDINVNTTGRYKLSAAWTVTAGNALQAGELYLQPLLNGGTFPFANLIITGVNGTFVGQAFTYAGFYTVGMTAGDVLQFPFQGDAFNGAQFNNNNLRIDIQRIAP